MNKLIKTVHIHIDTILQITLILIFLDMAITLHWWQFESNTIVTGLGLTNWIHIKITVAMFLPIVWYIIDQPVTRIQTAAYNANVALLLFIFAFHLVAVVSNLLVIGGYL